MMKVLRGAVVIAIMLLSVEGASNDNLTISGGVLDLRGKNLNSIPPIKLEGECEFYWNELLEPSDFAGEAQIPKPHFVGLPKSWTSYTIDGERLPYNGSATYRITVLMDEVQQAAHFGIKVPAVFSSYSLWVNGKLINQVGEVSALEGKHKPEFGVRTIPFLIEPTAGGNNLEIIFQVSNFSHRRAGLHWPVYFSLLDNMQAQSRLTDLLNFFIIGIIIIISFIHLNMYFFRRKERANLYFAIVCLIMILRNISTGDIIVSFLFPGIPWEWLVKLDNLSGFSTITLFALFFYNSFRQDFPVVMKDILVSIGLAIAALVIITPAVFYGQFRLIFEMYVLLGGLYMTFGVLLVASFRRREAALPAFLGMFILYATTINDVLTSMGLIQSAFVAPYGLVSFMIIQSVTITSRSAKAINQNERLSQELSLEKQSLEQSIDERTHELQGQHKKLIEHQQKEHIQNWIHIGITKVNDAISTNRKDSGSLAYQVLLTIIKYLNASMGAVYILADSDAQEPSLEMVAHYGCSAEALEKNALIPAGCGLVGATFTSNRVHHVENIPDTYTRISSGLGEAKPKSLLLVPLSTDEAVLGVLEIAGMEEFKPEVIDFMQRIAFSIATSINNGRINESNERLIKKLQEQALEMADKEEQMRISLEELELMREHTEFHEDEFSNEN